MYSSFLALIGALSPAKHTCFKIQFFYDIPSSYTLYVIDAFTEKQTYAYQSSNTPKEHKESVPDIEPITIFVTLHATSNVRDSHDAAFWLTNQFNWHDTIKSNYDRWELNLHHRTALVVICLSVFIFECFFSFNIILVLELFQYKPILPTQPHAADPAIS
jgi:hypothetical protein